MTLLHGSSAQRYHPPQTNLPAARVFHRDLATEGYTVTCCGTLRRDAGVAQGTPSLGLDGRKDDMVIALLLQVEQLNREIAHAWDGLRRQPGGLHCIDMLVRENAHP